jgi:hypothetical protein
MADLNAADAGPALTRFDFVRGTQRGTHLTLYPTCLVHRGEHSLETLPMAGIAAVRVAFERDARRLGWGIALLFIALVVYGVSGPLAFLAADGAAEMAAGGSGIAHALHGLFQFLGAVASALPVVALACALGGAALAFLGWTGNTALVIDFGGSQRSYSVHGRSSGLLDFTEALSERLMSLKR